MSAMIEVITEEERKVLLDWVLENESNMIYNDFGPYRRLLFLSRMDSIHPLIPEVKNRILEKEGITEWEEDPFFGDLLVFHTEKAFVHEHVDPATPDHNHVRYNLFLSKPEGGGVPVYKGIEQDFEERFYNTYHVNTNAHWSTPVQGSKPRVSISYGVSIRNDFQSKNFAESGYFTVRNFLSPDFVKMAQQYFMLKLKRGESSSESFLVSNADVFEGDPLTDTIMASAKRYFSEVAGTNVVPTYSYTRLFREGGKLRRHIKPAQFEVSGILSLGSSDEGKPETFYMLPQGFEANPTSVTLNPGDLCIHKGTEMCLWTEPLEKQWALSTLLNFVTNHEAK